MRTFFAGVVSTLAACTLLAGAYILGAGGAGIAPRCARTMGPPVAGTWEYTGDSPSLQGYVLIYEPGGRVVTQLPGQPDRVGRYQLQGGKVWETYPEGRFPLGFYVAPDRTALTLYRGTDPMRFRRR